MRIHMGQRSLTSMYLLNNMTHREVNPIRRHHHWQTELVPAHLDHRRQTPRLDSPGETSATVPGSSLSKPPVPSSVQSLVPPPLFYKPSHRLCTIVTDKIPEEADEHTCSSHPCKFRHIHANTTIYMQSFFLSRTIPEWNALSAEAVMPADPELAPS